MWEMCAMMEREIEYSKCHGNTEEGELIVETVYMDSQMVFWLNHF